MVRISRKFRNHVNDLWQKIWILTDGVYNKTGRFTANDENTVDRRDFMSIRSRQMMKTIQQLGPFKINKNYLFSLVFNQPRCHGLWNGPCINGMFVCVILNVHARAESDYLERAQNCIRPPQYKVPQNLANSRIWWCYFPPALLVYTNMHACSILDSVNFAQNISRNIWSLGKRTDEQSCNHWFSNYFSIAVL